MANALNVQRNDVGGRVIGQVIHKISQLQIDLIAGGNQFGQAHATRRRARQQRAQNAAALRHHADIAHGEVIHRQRAAGRERNVVAQVHQANRVGAEQAHRACGFFQELLAPRALFAGLGVAAGQHNRRRRAALRQLTHRLLRTLMAQQHDGHVRHLRQRGNVGVAGDAVDAGDARIHRVNRTAVALLAQVSNRSPGRFVDVGRGPDDGDAAGFDEAGDGVHAA